jgi:hypothetical protein
LPRGRLAEPPDDAVPGLCRQTGFAATMPGDVSYARRLQFRELGPAITDKVLGIIGGHHDSVVFLEVQVPTRVGLHGPYAERCAKANPRAVPPLGLLGLPSVDLEDTLARERLFEPVEELSDRVDLVVVFACRDPRSAVQRGSSQSRRKRDWHRP